jgi:hypothetical protein
METMEAAELEPLLKRIRWRKRALADALGCDEKTVRQMANGERAIPHAVAHYLRILDRAHLRFRPPPPEAWRVRWDLAPMKEAA